MKEIGGIAMKKTTKQPIQTEKNEPTNRLRQLRKKKGLTQLQMELKTGIDQSELSKMERGERQPTLDQALLLSKFFETNVEYICNATDDPTPFPRAPKGK